jgi:hypothetical protein
LEIDTAQDNAGRTSFELNCQELASGTLFNLVAQPHELSLALARLGFQISEAAAGTTIKFATRRNAANEGPSIISSFVMTS